ncbi:MAG: 3-isopropylmalate dehydratase large subunit [Armatimonadetes bacterium]|nr:3-isopropylmalate dehydratase large subunit [Armatimonadota bacterium]
MTITEKLLARAAGADEVKPGDYVNCRLDLVLANDITAPIAIQEFRKLGAERVFDPERIALVCDHSTPNKDINSAEQTRMVRDFAREQGITHYYEADGGGIEHIILPDKGLVISGDVVIGADSHTCTYGALGAFSTGVGSTDAAAAMALGECWFRVPESIRVTLTVELRQWVSAKDVILHLIGQIGVDGARYQSLEFTGPAIADISMAGRFTICNMAIEAGAKNGVVAPDEQTMQWMDGRTDREPVALASDDDAVYAREVEIDLSALEPQVSFPHLPENTRGISEVGDITIDQAVIGACTNGRLEDLREAADIIRGRHVAAGVRCIIIPGSHEIHLQATREGLVETFLEAGCLVSTPTCGPCLGGHMGVLAAGERAIATTNRNFVGRMGHPESEVYLASPAVTAASAVAGRICSPEDL